jgi:hypothetical protein
VTDNVVQVSSAQRMAQRQDWDLCVALYVTQQTGRGISSCVLGWLLAKLGCSLLVCHIYRVARTYTASQVTALSTHT